METMTLNNALETFSFGGTNNFNFVTFSEDVNSYSFTNIFFKRSVTKFFREFFGRSACFSEVIFFSKSRVLIILITKRKLESFVAISLFCSYLCNYTRTGFDDRAGSLFTRGIENAGHSNFFPNNTFHVLFNLCLQDYWDIHLFRETRTKASIPVCHRPFLFVQKYRQ